MTKFECAVIEAYTGEQMLYGKDRRIFNKYVSEILGRPYNESRDNSPRVKKQIREGASYDIKTMVEMAIDVDEIAQDLCEQFGIDPKDLGGVSVVCIDDLTDYDEECDDEEYECDEEDEVAASILDKFFRSLKDGQAETEENETETDNVNHPAHYQSKYGIEVIDVIEAFTDGLTGVEAVCTGNILKYVCRWKHKNGIEDLKKAEWYLKKLIGIEGGNTVDK